MVFLLCFCNYSRAQDFKWVYIPENLGNDVEWNASYMSSMVTDKDGNIYSVGVFWGDTDFDDSQQIQKITPVPETNSFFLLKLDKDKKFQWVKYFSEPTSGVNATTIQMIGDDKLLICVSMSNISFESVTIEPDGIAITTSDTLTNSQIGLIMEADLSGNITKSRLFDLESLDATTDKDNNIIVSGHKVLLDEFMNRTTKLQVHKLNGLNLQTIWQKEISGDYLSSTSLFTNSQGDIFMSGAFISNMTFAGTTYNSVGYMNNFICKFDQNGEEDWFRTNIESRLLGVDGQDNLFVSIAYGSTNVNFGNQVISVPYMNGQECLLLKLDSDANVLWNKAIYGSLQQSVTGLQVNSHGELILNLSTLGVTYMDGKIIFDTGPEINALVKLDNTGNFIKLKKIVGSYIILDPEDNILIGNSFEQIQDFDPHPVNKELRDAENLQFKAFILKLSPCDSDEPSGNANQSFCVSQNPTVNDLKIDQAHTEWFETLTSTVPLSDSLTLQDGYKYYAGLKKIPNCPVITQRLEVSVIVTAVPSTPVINVVQPCFSNELTLKDLKIQGQNLAFYETANSTIRLPLGTNILPDVVYYVSQQINSCEGPRTPFSISRQSTISLNDFTVSLCDSDNNNFETINLSDYNSFIVNNYSAQNHLIGYYHSYQDAYESTDPITDFRDYDAKTEKIYVRVFSNSYSCFDIAELSISLSPQPEIIRLDIKDWADNNTITVLPYNANHSYSLDGINYQSSNVFDKLAPGEYEVYVKDNGDICKQVSKKVFVLGYPKFFTPNGDGINDYWKIKFAIFQISINVEIYDRYGKLITAFGKTSIGWDGKLNGQNLPATDYWFRIVRVTDKEIIYRGHFSLVR